MKEYVTHCKNKDEEIIRKIEEFKDRINEGTKREEKKSEDKNGEGNRWEQEEREWWEKMQERMMKKRVRFIRILEHILKLIAHDNEFIYQLR